jgi:hypothetical protein
MTGQKYQIAVTLSIDGDGIARAIAVELENLGHHTSFFQLGEPLPDGSEVAFLFGPFGKFLYIPQFYAGKERGKRPAFVYWNTEGLPDPYYPRFIVDMIGQLRSWIGRWSHSSSPFLHQLAAQAVYTKFDRHMTRYRYLGDYGYARRMGWIDVFADISAVYAGLFRQRGIPAIAAPFGSYAPWYADLQLERDIDVLWMGKRATSRRSHILDKLRAQLQSQGVQLYMVDNVEHPFVFGQERTRLLNRTRITLNLLRTWYDENSLRICMAAPNRSMVVSEPLLPHVPQYRPGVHYASAPIDQLAGTILYYLQHEDERKCIVRDAYYLLTNELTFRNSMKTIMDALPDGRN